MAMNSGVRAVVRFVRARGRRAATDVPAVEMLDRDPRSGATTKPDPQVVASSVSDESARTLWKRLLRMPRVFVPILAVLALVIGLVVSGVFNSADAGSATPTTQLTTVTRGSMSESVTAEGTVEAAKTDNLSFSAAGTVTAVNVKAGDKVKAGQVLATIESAQLASDLASAQATVADAEAQLSDDRSSGASDEQTTSDAANLASAKDAATAAYKALAGASLTATIDGLVTEVNVTVGEQLGSNGTGGTTLTGSGTGSGASSAPTAASTGGIGGGANDSSSSDPDVQVVTKGSYIVELSVGSTEVANIAVAQAATLTVTSSSASGATGFPGGGFIPGGGGFPNFGGAQSGNGNSPNGNTSTGAGAATATGATATGKVADVAQVADASTGVARYAVKVTFTAGSDEFFVGSTVSGSIETKTRNNVLQVPLRAVTTTGTTSTVTVRKHGHDEERTVKTGLTVSGMVEITKGLKEGEQVVISLPGGFPTGAGGGAGRTGFPGAGPTGAGG